jgi:RND family efflux transporter MFP subunit
MVDDMKDVLATVESLKSPQARARIGGTIDKVVVSEGDSVRQGDLIARVRDPKLDLQLGAAEAKIAALQAQRQLTQTDLDRAKSLKTTGAAPQSRVDDAETQLVVTDSNIAAARAERAVVLEQQREGDVLAPADGRILTVPAVPGQVIMAGEPVATLATAGYVMKLRLPERHARFLKAGDSVLVGARGLDASPAATMTRGRITKVYPELERGQVVADAEATSTGSYFVGERIRVLISTGTRETILLPKAALKARAGVFTVTLTDGREVPVQVGQDQPTTSGEAPRIEILSGLRAGDEVVTP